MLSILLLPDHDLLAVWEGQFKIKIIFFGQGNS